MSPNGNNITRAMILAAGLGTRLRPLTETTPKPMIDVGGKPLIAHALERLATAGIQQVMINVHYLPEQIQQFVGDGSQWNLSTSFSVEQKLLGTGGGIKKVEDWFQGELFILYNADILCDFDVAHLCTHNAASPQMVLRTIQAGESYTPVNMNTDGQLTDFVSGTHHYCGIMRCTPQVVAKLPNDMSCLIQHGLMPALAQGTSISTIVHEGYWNDVGTLERLDQARTDYQASISA